MYVYLYPVPYYAVSLCGNAFYYLGCMRKLITLQMVMKSAFFVRYSGLHTDLNTTLVFGARSVTSYQQVGVSLTKFTKKNY